MSTPRGTTSYICGAKGTGTKTKSWVNAPDQGMYVGGTAHPFLSRFVTPEINLNTGNYEQEVEAMEVVGERNRRPRGRKKMAPSFLKLVFASFRCRPLVLPVALPDLLLHSLIYRYESILSHCCSLDAAHQWFFFVFLADWSIVSEFWCFWLIPWSVPPSICACAPSASCLVHLPSWICRSTPLLLLLHPSSFPGLGVRLYGDMIGVQADQWGLLFLVLFLVQAKSIIFFACFQWNAHLCLLFLVCILVGPAIVVSLCMECWWSCFFVHERLPWSEFPKLEVAIRGFLTYEKQRVTFPVFDNFCWLVIRFW